MSFEHFKGRRVLVTGHTGFKGSWLTVWLRDLGAIINGIALDPSRGRGLYLDAGLAKEVNDSRIDIRDRAGFDLAIQKAEPELVFHMAAQPLVLKSYQEPIETFDTNIVGTCNLLESLRKVPSLKGAVCITTDKVYENKESSQGYEEGDHLGGYDPYSSSKAACELVISSYARSFFNEKKVPLISVRAGNVIGGGDWADNRLVPDFFRALESSRNLEMRSPHSVRPWQHVMEPLSGYLTLGNLILSGRMTEYDTFNFGPKKDAQVSVAQIIEELNREVSKVQGMKPVEVRYVNPKHHETSLLWLNCAKASNKLHWNPQLCIRSTMELTSAFYLQNLKSSSPLELRKLISAQIQHYSERMTKS